jgi:hypothetical protein
VVEQPLAWGESRKRGVVAEGWSAHKLGAVRADPFANRGRGVGGAVARSGK